MASKQGRNFHCIEYLLSIWLNASTYCLNPFTTANVFALVFCTYFRTIISFFQSTNIPHKGVH